MNNTCDVIDEAGAHYKKGRYTVVVVAKNEEEYLPATLKAITCQTMPAHRVVLVDDGSTDNTISIAKSHGCDITTVPDTDAEYRYGEHINHVRNAGFEYISKDPIEYIVCVDADARIPPTYCRNIINTMEKYNAVVGTGLPYDNEYSTYFGEAGLVIRRDWFYDCVGQLLSEHRTLLAKSLCHRDVIVLDSNNKFHLQRSATPREAVHLFDEGRLCNINGLPTLMVLLSINGFLIRGKFSHAKNFISGYISKPSSRHSKEERRILSSIAWDAFCMKRLGRKNSKFQNMQDGVCIISMP